jgi:hypothetical protein
MRIGGIDPGITGAIGVYDTETGEVSVYDMPVLDVGVTKKGKASHRYEINEDELFSLLLGLRLDFVCVERVHARPLTGKPDGKVNASAVSMGRMCESFGIIRGILGALKVRRQFVEPQVWKRKMSLINRGKDDSRLMAIHRFPTADLGRKKDHNRAEALLLAEYARLYHMNL